MTRAIRVYNFNNATARIVRSDKRDGRYNVQRILDGKKCDTIMDMDFAEAKRVASAWLAPSNVKSEEPAMYIAPMPAENVTAAENRVISDALAILEKRMVRGETFTDPSAAGTFFRLRLQGEAREKFIVAALDTRHRLIACEELFAGTIDGCEVHPRIVAEFALRHNAAAVILAHNHPSGVNEPSAADRAVTARIKQALALIEVRVLDHFIVSDGSPAVSMASRGLI